MARTITVKSNKPGEGNPFYGYSNLKALSMIEGSGNSLSLLESAWKEAEKNEMSRQLFHIINFERGEIANREHYMFKGKEFAGSGQSNNDSWIKYLQFLILRQPKQFVAFLPLVVQFVGFRELLTYQVRTKKGTKSITGTWGLLDQICNSEIAYAGLIEFLVATYNSGNEWLINQMFKYLHIPRFSSKKKVSLKSKEVDGRRVLQSQTVAKMKVYARIISELSNELGWKLSIGDKYTRYTGFIQEKQKHCSESEDYQYSTRTILTKDREQFMSWYNKLPAGARYRVRRRLLDGDDKPKAKWLESKQYSFILAWDKFKEDKVKEEARLKEELKQAKKKGVDVTQLEEKVAKVEKAAKVTTGGISFGEQLMSLVSGRADDVLLNTLMNKVTWLVKTLVIADVSSSMNGVPNKICSLLSTIALLKNKEIAEIDEDLLVTFGERTQVFAAGATINSKQNQYMQGKSIRVNSLVDPTKSFSENFNTVSSIVAANQSSTRFNSVAEKLREWCNAASNDVDKAQRIEAIHEYQVLLVISDGDMNNQSSAATSMMEFQMKMKQYFNWEGVIVLWDVETHGRAKSDYFDNVPNMIHFCGYNASYITQVFCSLHDLKPIDNYTALQSLYDFPKYQVIKELVI